MSRPSLPLTTSLFARLRAGAAVALALTSLLAPACSRESLLYTLSPGVINDPSNKRLRFDILTYGLQTFCQEASGRGTPLRMGDAAPAIGRFYTTGCQAQVDEDRQLLRLTFSGQGWAHQQLTGRLAFNASASIEYAPDFVLQDGRMYVYFRPRKIENVVFTTGMVESMLARAGMDMTGIKPDAIGRQIFESQLQRGFTVLRMSSSGEMDFELGYVPRGTLPTRPFNPSSDGRITVANDRAELQPQQQDFPTTIDVKDDDRAAFLTLQLEGSAAIDVLLLPRDQGDAMRTAFSTAPGPARPAGMPLWQGRVVRGQGLTEKIPLPRGAYTLVFDHSPFGTVAPDGVAARVGYLVQLGDR